MFCRDSKAGVMIVCVCMYVNTELWYVVTKFKLCGSGVDDFLRKIS
jgi:hypothetical protein